MKLRIRFAKIGRVRWTSHRDVARMWERALRRARLPVAYTEGFSPRPKLSFGLALPTGCESEAEYLDVALASRWTPRRGHGTLQRSLARRRRCRRRRAPRSGAGSLQEEVTSCSMGDRCSTAWTPTRSQRVIAGVLGAEILPSHASARDDRSPTTCAPRCSAFLRRSRAGRSRARGRARDPTPGVRPAELAR